MTGSRPYLAQTIETARVLGLRVSVGRRERRLRADELAERAGIDVKTLRKVERGDPSVALGTALDVAALVGVSAFGVSLEALTALAARETDRDVRLPLRVRSRSKLDEELDG